MTAPILVVQDNPKLEAAMANAINMPLWFRAFASEGAISHGSTPVSADGVLIPYTPDWNQVIGAWPDYPPDMGGSTVSTTANQLIINGLLMAPPLAADLTISGILFALVFGIGASSGSAIIDKLDMVLSKVDATGVETALNTTTVTQGRSASGTAITPAYMAGSADFSPVTLTTTDALCVRVKLYCHSSVGWHTSYALNGDGSTSAMSDTATSYQAITSSRKIASVVGFKL